MKIKDTAPAKRDPWEGLRDVLDVPLEQLRAALAQSNRGVELQGAEVRQLPGSSARLSTSAGRLVGWTLRETTGAAPALVYFRDGRDATGALVAVVSLAAGESSRDSFPTGLSIAEGVYVDVSSGAVEGAVYLGGPQ